MKKQYFTFIMILVSCVMYGQLRFEKIWSFGEHQKNWAMIAQDGYLGFIDKDGNVVVEPKYDKISLFGEYQKDWALVEQYGYLGFIDKNGNEVGKPKIK